MTTTTNLNPAPDPTESPLAIRSASDVLAAIPVLLGYDPAGDDYDSVVMLTLGGWHQFHACLALPRWGSDEVARERQLAAIADALYEPAAQHAVTGVVIVTYTDDVALAGRVADAISERCEGGGITVVDRLRAHDSHWFPVEESGPGTYVDVESHEFRAWAVARGLVTLGSRAEIEASVLGDADRVAATAACLDDGGELEPDDMETALARGRDVGGVADPEERAAILRTLMRSEVLDRVVADLSRSTAHADVRLWRDLLQGAPPEARAHPATVLSIAAWLSGNGALARCALERCLRADPDHRMAALVADLLDGAVPPTAWSAHMPAGRGSVTR